MKCSPFVFFFAKPIQWSPQGAFIDEHTVCRQGRKLRLSKIVNYWCQLAENWLRKTTLNLTVQSTSKLPQHSQWFSNFINGNRLSNFQKWSFRQAFCTLWRFSLRQNSEIRLAAHFTRSIDVQGGVNKMQIQQKTQHKCIKSPIYLLSRYIGNNSYRSCSIEYGAFVYLSINLTTFYESHN